MYTNTWPDLTPHVRRQQEGCQLFPGAFPFSRHAVVQDRIDTDTPTCGATCFTFSCAASSPDNRCHCSIYILLKLLFRSLSLLPLLHTQTPPVSTHLSSILARVQKMQAHTCHLTGCSSAQHFLSYCPVSARLHRQGLHTLKVMLKAIG